MPATYPFSSIKENVYHNNSACGPGSEIPDHNRTNLNGGKKLCEDCAKLNANGR